MTGQTIRLTMAQALVRWLCAQDTEIDGARVPLFAGVLRDLRPWQRHLSVRGAGSRAGPAAHLARAERAVDGAGRGGLRQGAAAAADHGRDLLHRAGGDQHGHGGRAAHANRLPVLLLSGDAFASRVPDPVMQQVEHYGNPTVTVNDAFRAVTRYWDRIRFPSRSSARCRRRWRPCSTRPMRAGLSRRCARTPRRRPSTIRRPSSRRGCGRYRGRGPTAGRWRGRSRSCAGRGAPADLGRRRALFGRERGGGGVRGPARHPGGRDHRRQGHAHP